MTTLRRELRQRLLEVLRKHFYEGTLTIVVDDDFVDELADAALQLRAFSADSQKSLGLDWRIAAGLEVSEDDLARERHVSQATEEFERALLVKMPWGKESKFQKWVAEQYAKDPTCFARYAKWQKDDPFKSMSTKQIRHKPEELMDTWPAFEAMFKPKVSAAPDAELERLKAEAKTEWAKPPEKRRG